MAMARTSHPSGIVAASSTTRLAVFVVVALGSGWIGLVADNILGIPHSMESPAALIWIATPLLAGAVMALSDLSLRRLYAASWLPGRLRAYGVALAVFPLSFAVAIAVGWAAGWLTPSGLGAFEGVVAASAVATVLKNVAEEGAWRGYLTPALIGRRLPDPWIWLVVGMIWGLWHIPYYLWFLDESLIRSVWDVPPIVYALIAIAISICWAPCSPSFGSSVAASGRASSRTRSRTSARSPSAWAACRSRRAGTCWSPRWWALFRMRSSRPPAWVCGRGAPADSAVGPDEPPGTGPAKTSGGARRTRAGTTRKRSGEGAAGLSPPDP